MESFGPTLKRFALGEDDRPLDSSDEVMSISGEEMFHWTWHGLHRIESRNATRHEETGAPFQDLV